MGESGDNHRIGFLCLVLVLVTLAIYWPVRHYDFVLYDDPEYVSENLTVQSGATTYGLMWSFVDAHAANWHPITWISHMIDCQIFGVSPGAHHLVNVAFHCANAALLFVLLCATTSAVWRSAFVAAIFAWHPLRVESVAWVSERKDVLSGFFFLLTLLAYTAYAKSKAQAPKSSAQPSGSTAAPNQRSAIPEHRCSRLYWLSLALFVLGLLSKPMLVTVPFVLLLLDFWPLNRVGENVVPGGRGGVPRALLVEKVPFVILSLAVGVLTFLAQKSGGAVVSLKSEGLSERIGNAFIGYLGYLEKVFWPRNLAVLYLRPQGISFWWAAIGIVILLGLTAIVVLNAKARPYLAFGWLWFLGMLVPVIGLIQLSLQSIADRYTYLPAIGFSIIVVWSLGELSSAVAPGRLAKSGFFAVCLLVLLTCAALTRRQVAYWQNTETLMVHALEVDPANYIAHQDLALYYSRLGKAEAAQLHRERVRVLDPALRIGALDVSR